MEVEKVRIIHTKTGKTKMIMPHIAADTKMLFDHGWMVQDLKVKEVVKLNLEVVPESELKDEPLDLLDQVTTEEKPKGRKPKTK